MFVVDESTVQCCKHVHKLCACNFLMKYNHIFVNRYKYDLSFCCSVFIILISKLDFTNRLRITTSVNTYLQILVCRVNAAVVACY